MIQHKLTSFNEKVNDNLTKEKITVLQVNLGKKCNLSCSHCHVEASPYRYEELTKKTCDQLIEIINCFSQIKTVDLTGGAPEMNYGFKPLVESARLNNKEVIVRSNLTIFFESGYEDLPEYFVKNKVRVVASLPCYLEDNVDKQRGKGVYNLSILAIQKLNHLGYGTNSDLILDLVYNPPLPKENKFNLTSDQFQLEKDYKKYLFDNFKIKFNHLFTITNLPIGRSKFHLDKYKLTEEYLNFLADNFNFATLENLMCRNQLSVDYLGNISDCDFNQMEGIYSQTKQGEKLTLDLILKHKNLDLIQQIQTPNHCYGCTAGSGSSCGGALI